MLCRPINITLNSSEGTEVFFCFYVLYQSSILHLKLCTWFKFFGCTSKDKKVGHCPLGQGKILTQGLNSNNLHTGPPDNVSCFISKVLAFSYSENIYFTIMCIMKINDPGAGPILTPGL
jgi:hypothetical protein